MDIATVASYIKESTKLTTIRFNLHLHSSNGIMLLSVAARTNREIKQQHHQLWILYVEPGGIAYLDRGGRTVDPSNIASRGLTCPINE